MNHELEQLEFALEDLAEKMVVATTRLKAGFPPPDALADQIAEVAALFAREVGSVMKDVLEAGIATVNEKGEPINLTELQALSKKVSEFKRRFIVEVTETLATADRLLEAESSNGEVLRELRAAVARIRKKMQIAASSNLDLSTELRTEFETVWSVVSLVESKALDHETWALHYANVEKVFGKTLAAAAGRGKLIVKLDEPEVLNSTSPRNPAPITEVGAVEKIPSSKRLSPQSKIVAVGDAESNALTLSTQTSEMTSPKDSDQVTHAIEQHIALPMKSSVRPDVVGYAPGVADSKPSAVSQPSPIAYPRLLSAERVAEEIHQRDEKRPQDLANLSWALLNNGRYALSYWVSWYLEKRQTRFTAFPAPPSWLIEAVTWSSRCISPDGPAGARLRDIYSHIDHSTLNGTTIPDTNSLSMLAAAAAFRPALSSPQCGATRLLEIVVASLEGPFFEFAQTVLQFSRFDRPLQVARLQDAQEWNSKLTQLQDQVQKWTTQASTRTIIYAPATAIWREWQQQGGLIHTLLNSVRLNQRERIEEVRTSSSALGTDELVERLVDRSRRKAKVRQPIVAKALGQLQRLTREAVEFARQWTALHEIVPLTNEDIARSEKLRAALLRQRGAIAAQLEGMADRHELSWPALTCSLIAKSLVDSLISELEGTHTRVPEEVDRTRLLSTELLKLEGVRLTSTLEPLENSLEAMPRALIDASKDPTRSWSVAFQQQVRSKNHVESQWVLDELLKSPESAIHGELSKQREKALQECRIEHRTEYERAERALDQAILNDLIEEAEKSRLANVLESCKPSEGIEDFGSILGPLRKVQKDILVRQDARLKACRSELDSLQCKEADRKRIAQLIDNGDVSAANELIALARSGQPLPFIEDSEDLFKLFFPEALRELHKQGAETLQQFKTISERVETGISFPGIDLTKVTDSNQRHDSSQTLQRWIQLKRIAGQKKVFTPDPEDLRKLLKWLGVEPTTISRVSAIENRATFEFSTGSVLSSPVPEWGSSAAGRYRLVCVWNRPTEDQVLGWVANESKGVATVVFYLGSIGEAGRRNLNRLAREQGSGFLLVDDPLMLFLCSRPGLRLSALFACALPFTFSNPYTPYAAGNVPSEMFVGRADELREILDQHGSCFVYGGRQLGKSALLRAAQRTFHDPRRGRYAVYLDLKAEGIGESRTPEQIWAMLNKHFVSEGVLPKSTPSHAGPEVISDHLRTWINDEAGRRILLLLDEADAFLDADSSAKSTFLVVTSLKKLMENTDRRFKIVFAGLHTVQRFQAIPNQPLAHFGRPICVGSLRPHVALRLVEDPLAALGYRFATRDLAVRVLSHTNYQPSLIQLFCHDLLRHLRDSQFDPRQTPPCVITSEHIDDVYRSKNLRDRISERFEWTLNLDPRYRVLAYAGAHLTVAQPQVALEGFTHSELSSYAREWWLKGFSSASDDELRALIDEMVGLGLFVHADDGRYRLRSPNVLRLLGSAEQIENQLVLADSLEPPPVFEATTFRRPLKHSHPAIRSPLTVGDETDMLREGYNLRLLFGSKALGLGAWREGLTQLSDPYTTISVPEGPLHGPELSKAIQSEIDSIEVGFKRILAIPASYIKTIEGSLISSVELIAGVLGRRRQLGRTFCVIVIFRPEDAEEWLFSGQEARRLEASSALPLVLKRWKENFLQRWLDEVGIAPNDANQRARILAETGGWPHLMEVFYKESSVDPSRWRDALESIRQKELVDAFADLPNAKNSPTTSKFLNALLEWGQPVETLEEVADLAEVTQDSATNALELLNRMGLVVRDGSGIYVEPVASAILKLHQ